MRHLVKVVVLTAGLYVFLATRSFAGAPFLTDDPEPVAYQHWEAYFSANGDHTSGGYAINGPVAELNFGGFRDTQLHLALPITTVGEEGVPSISGLGDMECGVKYRFVHETDNQPQMATYPMVVLPTGDADRGLGNGRASLRLPLWLQKSFGSWTTYGGGGVALNFAPGQRDYPFGGWLVQRDLGEHLTLGGELFAQGRTTDDDQGFAALNFGGSYKFTDHFRCLFSGGHSIAGSQHTLWYFGLFWTW